MKVITSIYLNCRPDLRDEWLTGTEVDDISDAQVCNEFRHNNPMPMFFQAQEQALRHLVKHCIHFFPHF
jgi:hypothetical protein